MRREADPPPFPQVSRWRGEVAGAEARLQGLLPGLARRLSVRSVAYMSLQNQGDYLVEVALDLAGRVPTVGGSWLLLRGSASNPSYYMFARVALDA